MSPDLLERYEADGFFTLRGVRRPGRRAGDARRRRRHRAGPARRRAGGARWSCPRRVGLRRGPGAPRGRGLEGLPPAPAARLRVRSCAPPSCCPSSRTSSAWATSTASCRSSSSRTRAPGASRGTRTRYYFPFEPPRRIVGCGWPSPRPRSRTGACTCCPARTSSPCTSTCPTAGRRQLRLHRDRRPRHAGEQPSLMDPATCWCSTATSCTARPTTDPPASGRPWCSTYAAAGTVDRTEEVHGYEPGQRWVPFLRFPPYHVAFPPVSLPFRRPPVPRRADRRARPTTVVHHIGPAQDLLDRAGRTLLPPRLIMS